MSWADHTGDYYDNRDGNHAQMNVANHPGLTYMSSGYGAQTSVISDKVVLGNASLAVTSGDSWGSMSRVYHMRYQSGANSAYNLYINNNAYWYPEHLDCDTVDYYFTQTPTSNNSQGSSGTELDEMDKWFYILNAFSTGAKDLMRTEKLLIPTIQMIARYTRVSSAGEYLSGLAHPNVFDNYSNTTAATTMAGQINANNIPPMVQLSVVEDDFDSQPKEDFFEDPFYYNNDSEVIFDTPVTIARAFRGMEYTKRIVVSAQNSYDVNDLPLTYHWSVLRGDPAHVRITPLNGDSSIVEINIDYNGEASTTQGASKLSNLVSVGAFVNNGTYYSAPAFVTSYSLRNEVREYNSQNNRLEKITYNSNYLDPSLSITKSWQSDTFNYDGGGNLLGWDRLQDGTTYSFTKEGYLVTQKDQDNKPIEASQVSYSRNGTTKELDWQATGTPFTYTQSGNDEISPNSPSGLSVL